MYGIDRLDEEKPLNVLIYNMGGRDTEVSIVQYAAVQDERNKTYEYVEILAETWEQDLGGANFDDQIVDMLVDAFNSMPERAGKADIRTNTRAMKRLFKEAPKVKDILSANK